MTTQPAQDRPDRTRPDVSTEAAIYQRLRAHLDTLKLGTAAEALTGVLDTARAEQLSPTATLEQLLGLEVAAVESRRLAGRLRFACLPHSWTLDEFDFAAQPGVDEKLVRELAALRFLDEVGNHRNWILLNGASSSLPAVEEGGAYEELVGCRRETAAA